MHEPLKPETDSTAAHPIVALIVTWLFVFSAVLAALWVWF